MHSPISIAFVITELNPGGAEWVLARLLRRLDRRRFAPTVICLGQGGRIADVLRESGIAVHTLSMSRRRMLGPMWRLRRLLRELQPHLVQGWMYHGNIAASLGAAMAGIPAPVLWSIHSSADRRLKAGTRALRRLGASLSGSPGAILYVARRSARQHEALGYARAKTQVTPNGYELPLPVTPQLRAQARARLGLTEQHVAVGLVAHYRPEKDHPTFFAAAGRLARQHEHVAFLLAGMGVDDSTAALRRLVEAHGLQGRVHLLGYLPDVNVLLPALDVVCCSSVTEALPTILGEAMAMGVPCVTTDVGDAAELVGSTGLVVPARDPEALARALAQMTAAGAQERTRYGGLARERIRERFSLDAQVQRFEQMYEQMAGTQQQMSSMPTSSDGLRTGREAHVAQAVTSAVSTVLIAGQGRLLRGRGFRVSLLSGPGPQLEEYAAREGVAVYPLPLEREIRPVADLRALWRAWRLLGKLRPDLTNVGTPKAGLLVGLAAWLRRVPCRIYTLRGLRFETARGWKRRLLAVTESVACACAHRVLCVSPSLRERAIALGLVSRAKSAVLGQGSSNGVEVEAFAPTAERLAAAAALRAQLGIPPGAPVLGFVGRFTGDKGIQELVLAYQSLKAQHPQLRLLLVGDFEDGDPVPLAIHQAIHDDPGIVRTGFVADPAPYYHVMDVFVLPTHREGFPNTVLEAQAAGKPVVTTRATGAVDSIVDGETGLLMDVGDCAALAGAAGRLLSDSALAERMGEAGGRRVQTLFARERVVSDLAGFYGDLMAERGAARRPHGYASKRIFDLGLAVAALLLLSPVLVLLALLMRLRLGSPVLFRQQRPGLHGKPFTLLKFRTMTDGRDAAGRLLPDGERLTRLGRFLRSTSLDELPELWNVLRGEMSLVGPRPLLMEYLGRYTREQFRRHEALPGITGWAQVNGRNAISWEEKFAYDVWYVDNRTLRLDARILCKTLWLALRRQGISRPGYATMPEFAAAQQPASVDCGVEAEQASAAAAPEFDLRQGRRMR